MTARWITATPSAHRPAKGLAGGDDHAEPDGLGLASGRRGILAADESRHALSVHLAQAGRHAAGRSAG
ncbi:MAG TPA: hypothetical protein VFQ77_15540 [Pseudonocardiaceae bacterium]|nr:hypothetical protein [Pseudonocardiaceae bacterium]